MTYLEILRYNEKHSEELDTGLPTGYTKSILRMYNKPYKLQDSLEGPNTKIVFSEHFIYAFRVADSTECILYMSKAEKELYWDYLNYQGIQSTMIDLNPLFNDEQIDELTKTQYLIDTVYNTPEPIVRQLGIWAYAEVLQFDLNDCYGTMHVWDETSLTGLPEDATVDNDTPVEW